MAFIPGSFSFRYFAVPQIVPPVPIPVTKWRCLKCSSITSEDKVVEVNIYSYSLDEAKRRWLEFELKPKAQLTEFLKQRGYEITVNAIAPAFIEDAGPFLEWSKEKIDTLREKVEVTRLGNVQDVIRAFEYLMESPFVTGVTLDVNGGTFMI